MSHSSLLENGRGENRWSSECNAKCIWALLSSDRGRIKFKKSNECELYVNFLVAFYLELSFVVSIFASDS